MDPLGDPGVDGTALSPRLNLLQIMSVSVRFSVGPMSENVMM